jgi:hypothetical protein
MAGTEEMHSYGCHRATIVRCFWNRPIKRNMANKKPGDFSSLCFDFIVDAITKKISQRRSYYGHFYPIFTLFIPDFTIFRYE